MNLYFFNPWHDLALANNTSTFMPPAAALQMSNDLSLLPMWYADPNSLILSNNSENINYLRKMISLFPTIGSASIGNIFSSELEAYLSACNEITVRPWGWDKSVRTLFVRWGVKKDMMPSDKDLADIYRLSHRARAVELLPVLKPNSHFIGESYYYTDVASCVNFAKEHSDYCVFKAPLSGSGKGLNWCRNNVFSSPFERWCRRQISKQGGVVAEPAYNKVLDIGMEFFVNDAGLVTFVGYSFFRTTMAGVYQDNILVPDSAYDSCMWKHWLSDELKPLLQYNIQQVYGSGVYRGYLGVDMMLCKNESDNTYVIHPCVEINARMTMGALARIFYNRYVSVESEGEFHIDYYKGDGEAYDFYVNMQQQHPLSVIKGKIKSGYIALTPVCADTHFVAWALLNKANRV